MGRGPLTRAVLIKSKRERRLLYRTGTNNGRRNGTPGWVRGRRDHVGLPADCDDVGGVPPPRALAVVGVDGAALERRHGAFEAAGLVQRVGVDGHLRVVGTATCRRHDTHTVVGEHRAK